MKYATSTIPPNTSKDAEKKPDNSKFKFISDNDPGNISNIYMIAEYRRLLTRFDFLRFIHLDIDADDEDDEDDDDVDDEEDDSDLYESEPIICPRDCKCRRNMNGFMVATCNRYEPNQE